MRATWITATTGMIVLATSVTWAGTLTTVDAETYAGDLVALETSGEVVWRSAAGKTVTLPAAQVDRIDLAAVRGWADGSPGWLVTAGGMRFPGRPVPGIQGEVNWQHAVLGRLSFVFEDLRACLPPQTGRTNKQVEEELARLTGEIMDEDTVFLVGGDVVRGVVELLDFDGLSFNCKVGKLRIETSNIAGLTFSKVLKPYLPPETTHARLTMSDGSVLVGELKSDRDKLCVVTPLGPTLYVPNDSVVTIEFLNTKLEALSELEPVFVKETPYFDRVWHWQRNRSVWDRPLTIAGHTYESGIGMHARCQLDFRLDGKYRVFLSDVGIDDEVGQGGNCVVVAYGDGKALVEPVVITGKMSRKSLRIDVSEVKRLTLLADFGDDSDAGDHVTWGNTRLVKK